MTYRLCWEARTPWPLWVDSQGAFSRSAESALWFDWVQGHVTRVPHLPHLHADLAWLWAPVWTLTASVLMYGAAGCLGAMTYSVHLYLLPAEHRAVDTWVHEYMSRRHQQEKRLGILLHENLNSWVQEVELNFWFQFLYMNFAHLYLFKLLLIDLFVPILLLTFTCL